MTIEEKGRLLSLLKYEAEKNYCREVVTIAQGQNLRMGTIVGEKTADGTYKQVSLVDPTDEEATTGQFYASYELDHCMPKAEYPYLSICFFNFHPSCSVCNKRKSKGYKADSMFVEKQGDVFDMFEFSLKRSSILRYMLSNDKESLEIDYTCKGGAAQKKKYDEVFHITSIYSQHKDEAEELLWKARCYQDADIDAIFQHYRKLFPTKSKDDFRRMLYGHHLLPSQVHKRPLNKMLSDIAKQMKII